MLQTLFLWVLKFWVLQLCAFTAANAAANAVAIGAGTACTVYADAACVADK